MPLSGQVEVDEIFPGAWRASPQAVLRGKLDLKSTTYSDGRINCNGLVDLGYKKYNRVQHGNNDFVNETSHNSGTENF